MHEHGLLGSCLPDTSIREVHAGTNHPEDGHAQAIEAQPAESTAQADSLSLPPGFAKSGVATSDHPHDVPEVQSPRKEARSLKPVHPPSQHRSSRQSAGHQSLISDLNPTASRFPRQALCNRCGLSFQHRSPLPEMILPAASSELSDLGFRSFWAWSELAFALHPLARKVQSLWNRTPLDRAPVPA